MKGASTSHQTKMFPSKCETALASCSSSATLAAIRSRANSSTYRPPRSTSFGRRSRQREAEYQPAWNIVAAVGNDARGEPAFERGRRGDRVDRAQDGLRHRTGRRRSTHSEDLSSTTGNGRLHDFLDPAGSLITSRAG